MINNIEESIERLERTGRYSELIQNLKLPDTTNTPFVFELLFADAFEHYKLHLTYEFNANPANNTSVDFLYRASGNENILFELVSPEMGDELQNEYDQKIYKEGLSLSSDHTNQYLRPQAQTIRVQEKILEKVEKFPDPTDRQFSVIVVNCSNLHFEHFDDEDSRLVMYGKPKNPILTEYWLGKRILGLLDETLIKKRSSEFRQKVTAVIFIQKLQNKELLNGAWIICNKNRTETHRHLFKNIVLGIPPCDRMIWLEEAP